MSMTDKDNFIVKDWFEKYYFATINMLEKVYYKKQVYSYNTLIKRLHEMIKGDYIKAVKDEFYNRTIYIYNKPKIKPPSQHRIILLNLLAELKYLGFNIERFEIEKEWCGGKYRSDVLLQFTADNLGEEKGKRFYFLVEVQLSNNCLNLKKYDDLFIEGEVQRYLGKDKDYFPKILLISDRHYSDAKLKNTKVLQIDTDLNKLASILL